MPIFLKNKIAFIHIPKTGGTSIENTFENNGDKGLFFSPEYMVNGHSPQHSSYRELVNWSMIPDDFRIITVIRHPYERFVSEYNYRQSEEEIEPLESFNKRFLGLFRNEYFWDNHHLSCSNFIGDCKDIEIIRFETLKEDFKRITGLDLIRHDMKRPKILKIEDLTNEIKERIYKIWKKDFNNFNYEK